MRIGVLSDSHVPDRQPSLPDRLIDRLRGVDLIVHAGDLTCLDVLNTLGKIAEVRAVRGNMDPPEVRSLLQDTLVFTVSHATVAVMHGRGAPEDCEAEARVSFPEADIVIFGHSHRPFLERRGKSLILNPGPAVRFAGRRPSFAVVDLDESGLRPAGATIYEL